MKKKLLNGFWVPLLVSLFCFASCKSSVEQDDPPPIVPLDGRGGGVIAFSNTPDNGNNEIYLMNADGSGQKRLTDHEGRDCGPNWAPNAQKIAFYVHYDDSNWSIFAMNADGTDINRLTRLPLVCDGYPSWSPDNSQITFSRSYSQQNYITEIWVMNADGGNPHRIGNFHGFGPDWSPMGNKIVFALQENNVWQVCTVNSDGTHLQKLTDVGTENIWPSFSPDGNRIAFQSNCDGNREIYLMNADGSNPVRLTNSVSDDCEPHFSHDNTRIVFTSFRDNKYEVYVMNVDGSNPTRLTSMRMHNIQPHWRPQ